MSHVVLLGDSIFDNARYVPGGPSVIEHLRRLLPGSWKATLLAEDGSITEDVEHQLRRLPHDATHLIVSSGGNDALGYSGLIRYESAASYLEVMSEFARIRDEFQQAYRSMLRSILATGGAAAVCTVYDAIPDLQPAENAGLSLFNDVILREAFRASLPIIDLRLVCNETADYADSSPIEPSIQGGRKIARSIVNLVTTCDFAADSRRVYI